MKEKVIMVRTIGGEFIIGSQDDCDIVRADGSVQSSESSGKTRLKHARIFNIQMTGRGAAIGFMPPFPFSQQVKNDDLEIDNSVILLKVDESDIDNEIVNGYKSNITGLDLSAANKVVL